MKFFFSPFTSKLRAARAKLRQVKLFAKSVSHRFYRKLSLQGVTSPFSLKPLDSGLSDQFLDHTAGWPLDSFCRDDVLSFKLIAFYLPQFHCIPENDQWWGKNFTEWTNVRPAKPLFVGHYQPHVPLDLGYYNLLDASTQAYQVRLAKDYGISGFCFYFYWFNGKTLLEQPIQNYLHNSSLDLPFCLCWANENWSRRWDGKAQDILIAQNHDVDDDIAFIQHISGYLGDPRYIKVHGKPLVIVYRPSLLPDPVATARRWRTWAAENGVGELFLAYTQSFERAPAASYGFDAAIEFPPNNSPVRDIASTVSGIVDSFAGHIFDFSFFRKRAEAYNEEQCSSFLWRSVCPSWDNTARRKERATVFVNSDPDSFFHWIRCAVYDTLRRHALPNERLIFVNAWNEWAEGAHLEPDHRYGYAWLEACRRSLNTVCHEIGMSRKVVLLMHDCHPHGAQYLALSLCQTFCQMGFELELLALDSGPLADDFARQAPLHVLNTLTSIERANLMQQLQARGYNYVIANTTVCGSILHELALREFRILTLVHELPNLIRERQLEGAVSSIAQYSDKIVFPAELVCQGFRQFSDPSSAQIVVRHQGLIRANPYQGRSHEARQLVADRHGIPLDAVLVLAVAFLEDRKGPDLLVDVLRKMRENSGVDAHCLWVGHHDSETLSTITGLLQQYELSSYFHLIGFVRDPFDYYAAADVYALPSREDPFPNVVLECVHVGVPVVAFRGLTGCDALIRDNGGRLVDPLDCHAFASEALSVARDPMPPARRDHLALSMHAYALDLCHELMGTLRVSVVVPSFNYAHLLEARLEAIAAQDMPPYEIIILDDASTDDSVRVIEGFRQLCKCPSTLIVNSQNSGSPFRQWRKGVEQTSGDLVWIAEADDLCESNFLSEMVRAFSDPEVVLAYSDSTQIDLVGTVLAHDYSEWRRDVGDYWDQSYCVDGVEEIRRSLCVKNTIPNASGVLFRRDALKRALLDAGSEIERLAVAGDWRLYLELLRSGKCAFLAQSLNHHRRHEGSVTTQSALQQHALEVEQMQALAAEIIQESSCNTDDLVNVRARASRYLVSLRKQFGLIP